MLLRCVLEGDDEIDTTKVESTRRVRQLQHSILEAFVPPLVFLLIFPVFIIMCMTHYHAFGWFLLLPQSRTGSEVEEYDGETQGAIRKIMFDQNQKAPPLLDKLGNQLQCLNALSVFKRLAQNACQFIY